MRIATLSAILFITAIRTTIHAEEVPPPCLTPDDLDRWTGVLVYEGDPPEGTSPSRNFDVWLARGPKWKPELVAGTNGFDGHPCPSPDGSQIVYASHVDRNSRLFIYDLDTGMRRHALSGDEFGDYPTWLKEGIVYKSSRGWRIGNPETGATKPYAPLDRQVYHFTRSPNGMRMVVAREHSNETHLYLTDAQGNVERQLTDEHIREIHPHWHPKANRILYSGGDGTRDGQWEAWILDLDTGEKRTITTNPGPDWANGWTPDGEWAIIASAYGGNWDTYAIRSDGTQRMRLTCHAGNARAATYFSRRP